MPPTKSKKKKKATKKKTSDAKDERIDGGQKAAAAGAEAEAEEVDERRQRQQRGVLSRLSDRLMSSSADAADFDHRSSTTAAAGAGRGAVTRRPRDDDLEPLVPLHEDDAGPSATCITELVELSKPKPTELRVDGSMHGKVAGEEEVRHERTTGGKRDEGSPQKATAAAAGAASSPRKSLGDGHDGELTPSGISSAAAKNRQEPRRNLFIGARDSASRTLHDLRMTSFRSSSPHHPNSSSRLDSEEDTSPLVQNESELAVTDDVVVEMSLRPAVDGSSKSKPCAQDRRSHHSSSSAKSPGSDRLEVEDGSEEGLDLKRVGASSTRDALETIHPGARTKDSRALNDAGSPSRSPGRSLLQTSAANPSTTSAPVSGPQPETNEDVIERLSSTDDDNKQPSKKKSKKWRKKKKTTRTEMHKQTKSKKAKRLAKRAGVTVWKGLRISWKFFYSGLAMFARSPAVNFDVTDGLTQTLKMFYRPDD